MPETENTSTGPTADQDDKETDDVLEAMLAVVVTHRALKATAEAGNFVAFQLATGVLAVAIDHLDAALCKEKNFADGLAKAYPKCLARITGSAALKN